MLKQMSGSRKQKPPRMCEALIKARRERGWSQAELGRQVGLPQAHISGIETGRVTPRLDTLLDLVRVLGHDLVLVPRALVPMIQALERDHGSPDSGGPEAAERPLYEPDEDVAGDESGGGQQRRTS